jgi:hypothetical protein
MSTPRGVFLENRPPVLVRAFRGEPVKLTALADLGEVIEVTGEDETKTIGLPPSAVYRFEEKLFAKLRSAFLADDREELESLWRKARSFRAAELVS